VSLQKSVMHRTSWKGHSEKYECQMISAPIQILGFLCTTTTCSTYPYGVSGLRRHPRGLLREIYAEFCIWTAENTPSTHFGE
jgi:hypothetical protein